MTRKGNTLLCFLLSAAILLGTWAAIGAPVRSDRAICRRAEGELLTADITPVQSFRFGDETLMLARAGDLFLSFTYFPRDGVYRPQIRPDGVLEYRNNHAYFLGEAADAVTLTARPRQTWVERPSSADPNTPPTVTYGAETSLTYEGVCAGDGVWTFAIPDQGESLQKLAGDWYLRREDPHILSRSHINGPIPVEVTLYDGDGAVLDTLEFTWQSQELMRFSVD